MESCWKYSTLWEKAPSEVTLFSRKKLFPRVWFWDLRNRFWGPEIKHLEAHNFVFFLLKLSRNFSYQLNSNFHRFVILCICWDALTDKTSLWQLPIVSSVFNITLTCYFLIAKKKGNGPITLNFFSVFYGNFLKRKKTKSADQLKSFMPKYSIAF